MGKNDVFLDNGKKAKGSMVRFWEQQKLRQKNKHKFKNQEEGLPKFSKEEQEDNGNGLTSYDKWKNHQADMMLKKYEKGEQKERDNIGGSTQEPEIIIKKPESYDQIIKKVEKRQLNIPGYGRTISLQKKLNPISVPVSHSSSQNTQLPDDLKGLFGSPEELQRILKMNKEKKKHKLEQKKQMKEQQKRNRVDPFQRTLKDENYKPNNDESQEEAIEEVEEPKLFKSDILNKLSEGTKLTEVIKPKQPQKSTIIVESVQTQVRQKEQQEEVHHEMYQQQRKPTLAFVPRSVLIKRKT